MFLNNLIVLVCNFCFSNSPSNKANIFLGLIEYELNSLLGASHLVDYISVHIRFDLERYLLNISNSADPKWTSNLSQLPLSKIVHSVVEKYFQKSGDSKHIKEGYVFSKTLKFDTSGKPVRVNIVNEEHFLLEGYTRPAMKLSKGISQCKGIYHCDLCRCIFADNR